MIEEIYNLFGKLDPSYNLLTEAIDANSAYMKYYSDIDKDEYDKIISLDSSSSGKMTPLMKWLIDIYRRDGMDFNSISGIISKYNLMPDNVKKNLSSRFNKSNPNVFKNMDDFNYYLDNLINKEKNITKSGLVNNNTLVLYEDEKVKVIVPLTIESSKFWGGGSRWCTASSSAYYYYYNYMNEDTNDALIMFLDKKFETGSIQIHIDCRNFDIHTVCDYSDIEMDLYDFKSIISSFDCDNVSEICETIKNNLIKNNNLISEFKKGNYEKETQGAALLAIQNLNTNEFEYSDSIYIEPLREYFSHCKDDENYWDETYITFNGVKYFLKEYSTLGAYRDDYDIFFYALVDNDGNYMKFHGRNFVIPEDNNDGEKMPGNKVKIKAYLDNGVLTDIIFDFDKGELTGIDG